MLRHAAFLALGALLLACPSKTTVPAGLGTGDYVRLDGVLGDPLVVVDEVQHGVLACRTIPGDRKLKVPLSKITKVEPVSPQVVAKIQSVTRSNERMLQHLDEANTQIDDQLKALIPANTPTSEPTPDAPPMVDHPGNAPHSVDQAVEAAGGP